MPIRERDPYHAVCPHGCQFPPRTTCTIVRGPATKEGVFLAQEIVLIYEARIATVQILEQIFGKLQERAGIRFRGRAVRDLRLEDLTPASFPLFLRTDGFESYRLARAMRRRGIEYGYYLDDNFWELDPALPIGHYYGLRQVRRRLESIIGGASTILVSTPALREYLAALSPRVRVAESFFDFSLVPELPPAPPARSVLRGGFASSIDRIADVRPIFDEILALLDDRDDFEFEVIGAQPAGLPHHPRMRWMPYLQSYEEYIQFQRQRQWDFAIAPLAEVASNQYKTDNKYREYAAQGIPGIYQDMRPYAAVRDGQTGLIAGPQRRTWRAAIEQYLDDPLLRQRVRVQARADAETRLSIASIESSWLEPLLAAPVAGSRVSGLRWALFANRVPIPRWLQAPRGLVQAAAVSLHADGVRPTVSRAVKFAKRRVRGENATGPVPTISPGRLNQ